MGSRDELDTVRKLRRRIREAAGAVDLDLLSFNLVPGENPGDTDVVNLVFSVTAEAVETLEETEQRRIDDEFNSLFGASFGKKAVEFMDDETREKLAKADSKVEAAKTDLSSLLDEWKKEVDEDETS